MKLSKDNFKEIIIIKSFLAKLSTTIIINEIIYKNIYR